MTWEERYNQLTKQPANQYTHELRKAPQQKKTPAWEVEYEKRMSSSKRTATKPTSTTARTGGTAGESTYNSSINALGAGNYGKNDTSFLGRVKNTITGGLKGSLAGNMDTLGTAYQTTQGNRTAQNNKALQEAQWALARAQKAYELEPDETTKALLDDAQRKVKAFSTVAGDGAYEQATKNANDAAAKIGKTSDVQALYNAMANAQARKGTGAQEKAGEAARDLAWNVQQSGNRDIENAKEGLGGFGGMLVDAGAAMTQMGGDLAVNVALGTAGSMLPFAARAFGGATMQARQEGADLDEQILYGGAMAAKEIATEKMFNIALPFAKAYGKGSLDSIVENSIAVAVEKLGKTATGKRALNAVAQIAASGVGEGLEELIGDWMEWQLPRIYDGDVDSASDVLANSLYDFAVGGMAGVAGGVISPNTYSYTPTQADAIIEEAPTTGEVVETPVAEYAPTATQSVPVDMPTANVPEVQVSTVSKPTTASYTQKTGLGENGQAAYRKAQQEYGNSSDLYAGFAAHYDAGLAGISPVSVQSRVQLPEGVRGAAYEAGLKDATARLAQENAAVKRVTTNKGAGLSKNEYSAALAKKAPQKAEVLNELGKSLGVRIELVESVLGGKANGQYLQRENTVQIAVDAENPLEYVAAHEITHRIQELAPEAYNEYREAALTHYAAVYGEEASDAVELYRKAAAESGVELTREEVLDEIAADFTGRLMNDEDLFKRFASDNRTAAQKLLDALKEFIAKVKKALSGKARDTAAQEAYGTDFSTLEDIAQKWQNAFDAAAERVKNAETATVEGGGARYMIKQAENGAKYVQADRQVIFGNDPAAWSEQLENYINGKIRRGEDVQLIAEDGDVLTLTAKSAGKLSSPYDNNGRTMSEDAFERKVNAASHIDELAQVSRRVGRTKPDEGGRHGEMARDGWNYREAFFRDFDGTYYRVKISVAQGADGNAVYNIGQMKKEAFPKIKGSYAVSGNDPRGNTSQESATSVNTNVSTAVSTIPANGKDVKGKFSLKSYSDAEKQLHSDEAKKHFGKTYKWSETGYITTDGSRLDFSGRHDGAPGGYRTVDHRDIIDALGDDYGGNEYSDGMVQFMSEGNIRISPESGGIDLSVMPTTAQMAALSQFVEHNHGEVILDIDTLDGNTISSTEYPRGTRARKVTEDIRRYFEAGETPYVSDVSRFRYQIKAARDVEQELRDLERERTILKSRNKTLEEQVAKWRGEVRKTKTPVAVEKDVKRLGLDTIRRYNSDAKYSDIQEDLTALANAVMQKDVTMSDLMPHAKAAAETIVNNTTELTEYGAELLEIKDYLKHQKIKFDGNMTHYNEFRKAHMGTLKLNKSGGIPVDTAYSELSEMFGEGYFPSDLYTEADKVQRIGDVLDGMGAIYENPFSPYHDAAVQEIANELIDGAISEQVRQKKTYADRMELERQAAVGRVRELLAKEREARKKQVDKLHKEFAERTQKGKEKRDATETRARIARHTADLSRKLLNPTDKQHIPESLRKPVAALLESINLESAYSYGADGKRRKNNKGDPTRRTLQAVELRRAYRKILDGEENISVDPALLEDGGLLEQLEGYSDKRIADMNTSELATVWQAIRAIESSINSYNRNLSAARYATVSEWAERIKAESATRRRRNRKYSLDMVNPYTFFSAYGEAGMQVYRTLRNAQDEEHVKVKRLAQETEKVLDKIVYKNRNERHEYTTERGDKLILTAGQIMNLYNLARRGEQAMNHLLVGGIKQPKIKYDIKNRLPQIERGSHKIQLTEQDIQNLVKKLTPEQKKVADGLQKAASALLAEWGNEASMAVYGYRKFTEENYWPIQVAPDAKGESVEKRENAPRSIKNMGSAKALTPNATNALEIGDVYDVFSKNASDMIKYSTLLAPMEDINRLYNFRFRDENGNLTNVDMKDVLSRVYGDEARDYWINLVSDMQNGIRKSSTETSRAVDKLVANSKGAAVGANLRVVLQQPSAFFKSAVILDPDNMAKGIKGGVTIGNGWDKARKYSPIASIKDTSGFDQGGQHTISRELYGADGALEKLNDYTSWGAAKGDAMTWGAIWNACEWHVAEYTDLAKGSNEFYNEVARVFTDVIDQTQVVDGILQRPQIMREGNSLTRQATAFMGEPLTALNMLMRAYDGWAYETDTKKRSKALKTLKRTVVALAVTNTVNALAKSMVDGLRDDDRDEEYWDRVVRAFTGYDKDSENNLMNVLLGGNLASDMNPLGYIPYVKDALSIAQGFTVDRMDAGVIDELHSAVKAVINSYEGKGKKTTAYAIKQLISATAKVFGISVTNAGRDIWGIARSIAIATGDVRAMYEMERAIYRMDKSAGNGTIWCELLYMAQTKKDNETASLIYKDILSHGYDKDYVKQRVESIMKKEQGVNSVEDLKKRWTPPY